MSAFLTVKHDSVQAADGISFAIPVLTPSGMTVRLYNNTDYNPIGVGVRWDAIWLP